MGFITKATIWCQCFSHSPWPIVLLDYWIIRGSIMTTHRVCLSSVSACVTKVIASGSSHVIDTEIDIMDMIIHWNGWLFVNQIDLPHWIIKLYKLCLRTTTLVCRKALMLRWVGKFFLQDWNRTLLAMTHIPFRAVRDVLLIKFTLCFRWNPASNGKEYCYSKTTCNTTELKWA